MREKESPIAALLLKLKKQPDQGEDYDSVKDALRMQAKKLFKAIQTDDADKCAEAVCAMIDLHEPKPPGEGEEDDE